MIFNEQMLRDITATTSHEWLETNGLGGFSSSTIIGLNTRRYHGLLTAATKPPVGRMVLLSKLEETLIIDDRRYELSTNQYPGTIHPQGFRYQIGFRLDPFPVFTFEVDGLQLEESVFMVQGQNAVVVQYKLGNRPLPEEWAGPIKLEVRPLIAFRDYHSTTHENDALDPNVTSKTGVTIVKPYDDLPALHFAHDTCEVDTKGFWYRNFQYSVEQERGLDFAEDLFSPFALTFDLGSNSQAQIIAATEQHSIRDTDTYRQ
ncbi:MAG TPA: glycogen debranching enzyme N-terminal domain-containing protein, partial [Pyrinomonadaceae bacterium]